MICYFSRRSLIMQYVMMSSASVIVIAQYILKSELAGKSNFSTQEQRKEGEKEFWKSELFLR